MATFRRLRVVGSNVRIGNQDPSEKRRGSRDSREILNTTGKYTIRTNNGQDIVADVIADRSGIPKVKADFHGNEVLIPLTDVARSIKTDPESGRAQRVR